VFYLESCSCDNIRLENIESTTLNGFYKKSDTLTKEGRSVYESKNWVIFWNTLFKGWTISNSIDSNSAAAYNQV